MTFADCYRCRWFYARRINGFADYMCTWRKYNANAVNKYGEIKPLTPGRLVNIAKIKSCNRKEEQK